MKIIRNLKSRQQGSVLLVALVIASILAVTLASYLVMTQSQNVSVVRSQTWNTAMVLTEAGVEDGLAMINKYNSDFGVLTAWTNSVTSDGYSYIGNNVYYVRRYVDTNNWGVNYYDVYITNTNNQPSVSAQGYAAWKYSYASAAPQAYFAAVNVTAPNAVPTSRKVVVNTKVDALFNVAMAAIEQITLSGFNVNSDSFDSGNPSYSNWQGTFGTYPTNDINKTKAGGDIVTDYMIVNALNVGNAKVKGKVKTGPNGSIAIGSNGSVGERDWVEGGNTGIQDGHSANDMNVYFPPVVLPTSTWISVPAADRIINGVHYDYAITTSGDWYMAGLAKSLYIGPNISVRIRVDGTVSLTGSQDEIRVSTGTTVKFYMNSAKCVIKGNGVVNDNNQAINFQYYGTPNNTELTYGGNGMFVGVIYAPNAVFTLGGGGSDNMDFIGSSVSKSVKMNGNYNFHYDENLNKIGPGRGYIPINWKEM